jgi:hypothetical protein
VIEIAVAIVEGDGDGVARARIRVVHFVDELTEREDAEMVAEITHLHFELVNRERAVVRNAFGANAVIAEDQIFGLRDPTERRQTLARNGTEFMRLRNAAQETKPA